MSIATLGLGIGAATALFSVIYNVLLAPFPYRDAERMVFPRVYDLRQGPEIGRQGYTAAEVLEFGVAMSLLLGQLIGTQLMGVTSYDPPTLAAAVMLLTVTATLAPWIPARRAAPRASTH